MAASPQAFLTALSRLPAGSKLGLLVGTALIIALGTVTWMWSTSPDYRVLFSNISDRDGGAIVSALTQMNVPYKFAEGGGAILVPSGQVHDVRLRLASQGLPKGSLVGFEMMETQKFGLTQFQEQVNYQRALEGELARSIQSVAAVQTARVHLAIPKPSVFMREQQKPTASVLVSLYPSRSLERTQVTGIVHLVSSSVPELSPRNISVLDQLGNLLSGNQGASELDPSQLAYVQQIEAGVVRRIQDILEPIVGRANVRAQVTADVDFSQSELTAESYKPNQAADAAAVRTQQIAESSAPTGAAAQGIPGPASNQPGASAAGGASGTASSSTRRDTSTNYEVDRSVRRVRQPVGTLKRLSAAVVVNHRTSTDAQGKVTTTPLPEETLSQINALAREAMGYTQSRGDTLNVAHAAFRADAGEVLPPVPLWQQPENISLAKDLGRNLLLGLLVLYLLLGIIRPLFRNIAQSAQPPEAEPQLEMATGAEALPQVTPQDRLESVRELARQDPRIVANVVRSWVTKE